MALIVIQYLDFSEHHIKLIYMTGTQNAVTCSNDHIFVAAYPPSVHIYTWNGHHTQHLTRQQLGLPEYDRIEAIKYSSANRTLHLAVGETVLSIYTYKVSGN